MLALYNYSLISHDNINSSINSDGAMEQKVLSLHSEIERPEYSYIWNSDGIRWKEFSENDNVITIGCSMTFGLGLPLKTTWPYLLEQKLKNINKEYSVANLSYNGASAVKNIIALFSYLQKYKVKPKYIIANFANFERSYVPSQDFIHMQDFFWNPGQFQFNANFPYNWQKIFPVEWAYYTNFQYIRALEVFCEYSGINLIWSTWSSHYENPKIEDFILKNYKYYFQDITRNIFKNGIENPFQFANIEELKRGYDIKEEFSGCHTELLEQYPEIFAHAYDYHQIPVNYIDGKSPLAPHPGVHRQAHWAELYFNQIMNMENHEII